MNAYVVVGQAYYNIDIEEIYPYSTCTYIGKINNLNFVYH